MKLYSIAKGTKRNIEDVNDDTFSQKMMGDGVAIIPEEGEVFAPESGEITMLFPTLHAIGLKLNSGVEVLIHIGIDTVEMEGNGFVSHIHQGTQVKKGELLISFNIEEIEKRGYESDIMVIITNTSEYQNIKSTEATKLQVGDVLLEIE